MLVIEMMILDSLSCHLVVQFSVIPQTQGVDETMTASLVYSKGRVASISASIKVDLPTEGFIIGTKGTIKVT